MDSKVEVTYVKGENVKRAELYLKGGVFCVSYKQLILDLLCKKVSPSIIDGLILAQAHKCHREQDCETFLIKMVKRENQKCFVKCISDQADSVRRGGLSKLEQAMKALHVDKLLLKPRICDSVKNSLEPATTLQVAQKEVSFSPDLQEMYQLLTEIMQACLDETRVQFKMYFKNCGSDDYSDV